MVRSGSVFSELHGLRDMPSETRVATVSAQAMSRLSYTTVEEPVELAHDGNSEWNRVPLGALLERAGMEKRL